MIIVLIIENSLYFFVFLTTKENKMFPAIPDISKTITTVDKIWVGSV